MNDLGPEETFFLYSLAVVGDEGLAILFFYSYFPHEQLLPEIAGHCKPNNRNF